jgi:hypothetical protein
LFGGLHVPVEMQVQFVVGVEETQPVAGRPGGEAVADGGAVVGRVVLVQHLVRALPLS